MRALSFIMAMLAWLLNSSQALAINSFIKGECENDRQWYCNIEFDEEFKPTCISGLTCDNVAYNSCAADQSLVQPTTQTSTKFYSGSLQVEVSGRAVYISLHEVYTGRLVMDFGVINPAEPFFISEVESGYYILISRDQTTNKVLDSDLIMIQ